MTESTPEPTDPKHSRSTASAIIDFLFPMTPLELREMRKWNELIDRCEDAESRASVIAARDAAFRATAWATGGRFARIDLYVWPVVALAIVALLFTL